MDKYKNKYRIKSHRKPKWDYSADALYFLTINTQNRECNLGKIINNEIQLSEFGKIVETEWYKSFEIRNELIGHQFVIMPNHLHAIVEINTLNKNTSPTIYSPPNNSNQSNNSKLLSIKRNPPLRLPKSISSFIAGFKSSVNTKIDNYIDEQKLSIPKYNRNNRLNRQKLG